MTGALHEWHEFYFLLGSASAALVALLFVAVSIGVGFFTEKRAGATRTYLSPVVIHFTSILFMSAVALAPANAVIFAAITGLTGLVGTVLSIFTTVHVFTVHQTGTDRIDRFAYGLIPVFAYVAIAVAAGLAAGGWEWSLHLMAAAILLLLIINIRNAWDLMLMVVRRQARRR